MKSKTSTTTQKSSHKKLWILLGAIAFVLIMPILYLGWLGFVPGVSSVMGSTKPRDLGVTYDSTDNASYQQKTNITFADYALAPQNPSNPAEKTVLSSPRTVNMMNVSQEEITSAINSLGWDWLPLEDVQVRITENTIEISGLVNLDKIDDFSRHISNNNDADSNGVITWAQRFQNNPPFYIKANASIQNNVLSYAIVEAEIGRLGIPISMINEDLASGNNQVTIQADNLSLSSATLTNGNLLFTGTYPSVIYINM